MIRYIAVSLVMFFLPGYTFINALFPGKNELDEELDGLYRISFSIVMSVVFIILFGYILGNMHFIVGYGSFYRSRYIWTSLLLSTVIFFVFGWYRGAYQWMGEIHPVLDRPSPKVELSSIDEFELVEDMEELVRKQHELKQKIKKSKKKRSNRNEIKDMEDELEEVTEKLKELEERRAKQLEEME